MKNDSDDEPLVVPSNSKELLIGVERDRRVEILHEEEKERLSAQDRVEQCTKAVQAILAKFITVYQSEEMSQRTEICVAQVTEEEAIFATAAQEKGEISKKALEKEAMARLGGQLPRAISSARPVSDSLCFFKPGAYSKNYVSSFNSFVSFEQESRDLSSSPISSASSPYSDCDNRSFPHSKEQRPVSPPWDGTGVAPISLCRYTEEEDMSPIFGSGSPTN